MENSASLAETNRTQRIGRTFGLSNSVSDASRSRKADQRARFVRACAGIYTGATFSGSTAAVMVSETREALRAPEPIASTADTLELRRLCEERWPAAPAMT